MKIEEDTHYIRSRDNLYSRSNTQINLNRASENFHSIPSALLYEGARLGIGGAVWWFEVKHLALDCYSYTRDRSNYCARISMKLLES